MILNVLNLLYLICILHQTTTDRRVVFLGNVLYLICILHQTTTDEVEIVKQRGLYLICILHQTTTDYSSRFVRCKLYLICILHQTTTPPRVMSKGIGCILFVFYIKPQHDKLCFQIKHVVSYLYSTSNHNWDFYRNDVVKVVSYLYSTSNHNLSWWYSS